MMTAVSKRPINASWRRWVARLTSDPFSSVLSTHTRVAMRVAGPIPDGLVALPLDMTTKVGGGEALTFIDFLRTLPPQTLKVTRGSLQALGIHDAVGDLDYQVRMYASAYDGAPGRGFRCVQDLAKER